MTTGVRKLEMKFAGGLVEHLGFQMYTGVVPAILEFVANAWDADATRVDITLPLDQPVSPTDFIEVLDNGLGMSFDDCNNAFLVVGRNRRQGGKTTTDRGRHVLGRKGIGKLAAYGVARRVEVYTAKDGMLTAFAIDYDAMTRGNFVESYEPEILADRPVADGDPVKQGTLIRLTKLQISRAIGRDAFRKSFARRFALLSGEFSVYINGERLERSEIPLDLRIPSEPGSMQEENVPEFGPVKWWIGFTRNPIEDDEQRGIVVFAHEKMAQSPFFFQLSKGTEGQLGLHYMTGEVYADGLDGAVDLIATDRMSVRWEDPNARPLLEWGQQRVKEALRRWRDHRINQKLNRSRHADLIRQRVDKLTKSERDAVKAAINKLASVETMDPEEFDQVLEYLLHGFENKHFLKLINDINAADEEALPQFMELVTEWDVLEAVQIAHIVRGHQEIINKFAEMIEAGVREKPDMQEYLRDHPWLLNPAWNMLYHEVTIDRLLRERFGLGTNGNDDRVDFFCLADSEQYVIVEVKRPGETVGREEIRQLEDYVDTVREHARQVTAREHRKLLVRGILVAHAFRPGTEDMRERLAQADIETTTWLDLLQQARRLHQHMFEVAKSRAPNDPRVERLAPGREVAATRESFTGHVSSDG